MSVPRRHGGVTSSTSTPVMVKLRRRHGQRCPLWDRHRDVRRRDLEHIPLLRRDTDPVPGLPPAFASGYT